MRPDTLERVKHALALYATEGRLADACFAAGISYPSIVSAVREYPLVAELYRKSKELRADILADEVVNISDDDPNPNSARVRCEARRWAAGVLNRKVYGDKVDMTIESRVDMTVALTAARQRTSKQGGDLERGIESESLDNAEFVAIGSTDNQSVVPSDDDPFSE